MATQNDIVKKILEMKSSVNNIGGGGGGSTDDTITNDDLGTDIRTVTEQLDDDQKDATIYFEGGDTVIPKYSPNGNNFFNVTNQFGDKIEIKNDYLNIEDNVHSIKLESKHEANTPRYYTKVTKSQVEIFDLLDNKRVGSVGNENPYIFCYVLDDERVAIGFNDGNSNLNVRIYETAKLNNVKKETSYGYGGDPDTYYTTDLFKFDGDWHVLTRNGTPHIINLNTFNSKALDASLVPTNFASDTTKVGVSNNYYYIMGDDYDDNHFIYVLDHNDNLVYQENGTFNTNLNYFYNPTIGGGKLFYNIDRIDKEVVDINTGTVYSFTDQNLESEQVNYGQIIGGPDQNYIDSSTLEIQVEKDDNSQDKIFEYDISDLSNMTLNNKRKIDYNTINIQENYIIGWSFGDIKIIDKETLDIVQETEVFGEKNDASIAQPTSNVFSADLIK